MKKNIILAIAAITTLTLLAGCGAKDTAVSAAPIEESKVVEVAEVVEATPEPVATPEPTPEPTPQTFETPQMFEIDSFGHKADVVVNDPYIAFVEKVESEDDCRMIFKLSTESDITIDVVMDKFSRPDSSSIKALQPPFYIIQEYICKDRSTEICDGYLIDKVEEDINHVIVFPVEHSYDYMEYVKEYPYEVIGWSSHIVCSSPTASCDELVELCKELNDKITVAYQEESPTAEEYKETCLYDFLSGWASRHNVDLDLNNISE